MVHGGLVYLSGQLPLDPVTGAKLPGPIETQAERVLQNLAAILAAAGTDRTHVLRMTVYVADLALWGRVNEVCARFFGDYRPARAVVPTGPLHHGCDIEVEMVAALP